MCDLLEIDWETNVNICFSKNDDTNCFATLVNSSLTFTTTKDLQMPMSGWIASVPFLSVLFDCVLVKLCLDLFFSR